MKIAFVLNEFPALSETFILNQITGLLDLGHEVEIFAKFRPNQAKMHPEVEKYQLMKRVHYFPVIPRSKVIRVLKGIYFLIFNFHKDPIKILNSLNVFKHGRKALSLNLLYRLIPFLGKEFDVIHCHFGPVGEEIGANLKQVGFKGKLVTMFHGYDIRRGLKEGGSIYAQLFKFGDCFLAISGYNYKNLIRFGADPQKIIFHPVGIDVSKFPYKWCSHGVAKPINSIVVLTVARLVEEKGIEYGIQAVGRLLSKHPKLNLKYWIIGGGSLEKQLKEVAEELGLGRVVKFLGPMEHSRIIEYMQKADIFLLPSVAEALPVVLMEAQAIGLPVVATSVGSVTEAMVNNKSGFIVRGGDADALAERLEYLIKHPEIWPKMGEEGRNFVERKFDVEKLNRKLVNIYKELISS
jgi:colanic acid/amylovoran biosynthesis glycosyltransferase